MRVISSVLLAAVLGAGPAFAAPAWHVLPGAPVSARLDDVHFLDPLHGWVCDSVGRLWRTTDGGANWELMYENNDLYFRCVRFADPLHGFAGTLNSDSLVYRTVDGGVTWTTGQVIPDPRPNALCGLSVASSQVIYGVGSYAGPARMIKSTDGGATWSTRDFWPLLSTVIDVYFKNPSEGFVVGSTGQFPNGNRSVVLHTTDGGANWQPRYVGTRFGEWGWKISFPSPAIGYVSLERFNGPMFVLKTVDGGLTWSELSFPNYNEQGIGFATPEVGWVGGHANPTFGTTDGGASWNETPWGYYLNRFQFLNAGLGYGVGETVYKYFDATVAVGEPGPASPKPRVAPNPFRAKTIIRFTLAREERVQLTITDPAGRIVRTLENGVRGAGAHRVEWDGRSDAGAPAPAGIYLYVLHAGEQHEMGKLVRVR